MDSYLERLHEAITSAIYGITTEDLRRHPEGKWSTAEVLEHLYLTYSGTMKVSSAAWRRENRWAVRPR